MDTTVMMTDQDLETPSKFGLKFPLNHEFPVQSKQIITPTVKQFFELMPLTARYLKYYVGKRVNKKKPIMDYVNMISAQRMYGCPIGGIGGGTIGRGFKGEFCRFQLYPGIYEYVTVPECQFIVNIRNADNETIFQSVMSTYTKPKKAPSTWQWGLNGADCEYTALYPVAWTTYNLEKYGVKLVCKQISPVIPHNYKDSSLPCAVFVWTVRNVCDEARHVSISFTWTQILPQKNSKTDIERYSDETTSGVTLEQKIRGAPCTFTVAKTKCDHETIHEGYCTFNAAKTSQYVWECIKEHGKLMPDNHMEKPPSTSDKKSSKEEGKSKKTYKADSIGLSSVLSVEPGGSAHTEFCLAWDMPVIKYKVEGKLRKRYYTKYFGSDGIAGTSIAAYALKNYKRWDKQIAEWREPILNNSNIPDWLKSALMNELYYVADGGTIWFDSQDEFPETDPRHHYGLFAYLEGHEYRMYSTYDVHFYASFALAQLWPNLQVVLQYMYRDSISHETEQCRTSLYDGKNSRYKVKDTIPHDLGDPEDEPFHHINSYNIHDVSVWRDLNLKFILQVARDHRLLRPHCAPFPHHRYESLAYIDDAGCDLQTRAIDSIPPSPSQTSSVENEVEVEVKKSRNILEMLYNSDDTDCMKKRAESEESIQVEATWDARQFLEDMYEPCLRLLRKCLAWDRDGDGLVENSGTPDQTFDAWTMKGPSAYCGGLWLASISSVRRMARILNKSEDEAELTALLERATAAYHDKLWTGQYYKFDTRPCNEKVVMADQLAGQWFLRASGISEEIFPSGHVRSALRVIFENNVRGFLGGRCGAVNGARLGGRVDTSAVQSKEMWTGVTYGLAALMIHEGMYEEAFATAGGMYNTLTEQMGLAFETPEALTENGHHRSVAYMRPLAVWGMYQAITSKPPTPIAKTNGHVISNTNL